MKNFDREDMVQQCRERHPEAESDIVAVDLTAQELYKVIQNDIAKGVAVKNQYDEIEKYSYLKTLRQTLLNEEIEKQSSHKIKEAV